MGPGKRGIIGALLVSWAIKVLGRKQNLGQNLVLGRNLVECSSPQPIVERGHSSSNLLFATSLHPVALLDQDPKGSSSELFQSTSINDEVHFCLRNGSLSSSTPSLSLDGNIGISSGDQHVELSEFSSGENLIGEMMLTKGTLERTSQIGITPVS
ncbi:hypothetical protein L1049_012328 [Liquidambar formosana]|uniref:Uncharacterized protein n=1 Tax=Liquidambar formosana TaxID=63359 RepID=A0AAP0RTJ0_LIQFO